MLLKEVSIKNFRSLKDVTVPLNRNTILIGENNSGKTAFLDALRIGLGKINRRTSPFEEYDFHLESNKVEPQNSDGISIQFTFQEEEPDQWSESTLQILGDIVQFYPWENDAKRALNTIILQVISKYDLDIKDYIIDVNFLNINGDTLGNKKLYDIQQLSPIFYLQALRDIQDFFSVNSQFWGRFLRKINIDPEKLGPLQESILKINEELISSDGNLEKIKNSLESIHNVLSLNSNDMVSINALPLRAWDILSRSQVVMKGKGNEADFPLHRHGQGTQSLATLFLFQAYIDVLLKSTFSEDSEAILAFEEPEAHLHPQATRSLANKLELIECQKIISTHSPYVAQNASLFDLRLFRKIGKETFVYHLKQNATIKLEITQPLESFCNSKGDKFNLNIPSSILTTKQAITEQESRGLIGMYRGTAYESEMLNFIKESQTIISKEEENQLYTFIQRTRGELFFARGWLLAEGQTEYIVLQYFSELINKSLDNHGVSIIDYQNNGSPGAFVKIAKLLNYPWVLLSDNDMQGDSTISQLKKLGYNDNELSSHVFMLPHKDFETFLVHEGFYEEYKIIAERNGYTILKDALGLVDKENLAMRIQEDKVGNARKLVDLLKESKADVDRVPILIRNLIEGCVEKANE